MSSPSDKNDVLSDVFATLRIRSELYFTAELGGAAVEVPAERRRIRFHLVRFGRAWISLAGRAPEELGEGDIAIVPNGAAQIVSSRPGASAAKLAEIVARGGLSNGVLSHGGGEHRARLLCGFCRFDEALDHPVLTGLPELVVVRPGELGAEPWTAAALRLLMLEAELAGQGSTGILARLLEIVLIQAVRRLGAEAGAGGRGFITALGDARLSRAMNAMHGAPERNWTIHELARLAGMSRANFAERFTAMVGIAPIGYLTAWRLMRARALLAETGLDMAEVAARCGYASVPSFSRRFKRAFGTGPGAYRRTSGAP